jgi:FkbM family methyltransferase
MRDYYNQIITKTNIDIKTILEIGSRDGHDANTLKVLSNVSDESVWVIEPNPNQCEIIKKNYPNFNLIDMAISDKDGVIDFYQVIGNDGDVGTSSTLNRADDWYIKMGAKKINVNSITGISLLKIIDKKIDLCKIDVEGLTYEVLTSFGDHIKNINSFHLECEHREVWKNQKLFDDVSEYMTEMGYVLLFSSYNNGNLQSDTIWVNKNMIK